MSTGEINDTDSTLTGSALPREIKTTDKQGQIALDNVDISISNSGEDIEIGNIYISLPCGNAATDLVVPNTDRNIAPVPGIEGWDFDLTDVEGRFLAKPEGGSFTLEGKKSVGFSLNRITLSHLPGDVEIVITVFPPSGNTPLAEFKEPITKILDVVSWVTLTTITPVVCAKEAVKLLYTGKGIAKFAIAESTSKKIHTDTKDGELIVYPETTTYYTLEGTAKGIRLQTQLTVGVLLPKLKKFELVSNLVDEDGDAILNWDTEYADHIILTCDDKEVPLQPNYPKTGSDVKIGPIKRATTIHAQSEFNGVLGAKESHNIRIAGPRVESFNITAVPLEPGKKVTFKLDWVIKNTRRFQITEHYAGQTDIHKLPIPEGVTTCLVYPTHAETTYKIESLAAATKKTEEEIITE